MLAPPPGGFSNPLRLPEPGPWPRPLPAAGSPPSLKLARAPPAGKVEVASSGADRKGRFACPGYLPKLVRWSADWPHGRARPRGC